MNKDLTVGRPDEVLWKFSLPLFGSIVFQQLYNIADSLVAGKFVGETALAAVGNSYEITLIYLAFGFGCNIGCSVIVSQLFGARNWTDMKTAVRTTYLSSAALCAVLMLIGFVFAPQMLQLINTPAEIFDGSLLYLNIYTAGLIFLFFYNITTGIFSAMGDSRTPFLFLAFSSVANIFVDMLFVIAFHMGVAGVAWATFLCQSISCVLSVYYLMKRLKTIQTVEKPKWFSLPIFRKLVVIAVPSILQQSFVSFGNIIIQGLINSFGASITAGYAAAIKLNNLVITSFTTLGNGMSNFTAQNYGAGKMERIRQGCKAGIKMIWMLCVPVVALYLLAGRQAVHLFMDKSTGLAMDTGVQFLRIVVPFYFVVSVKLITDGVLRGTGCMKQFMIDTFADLILRVGFAIVLASQMGIVGIWCAWPVGWIIGTLLSVYFYKTCKWEEKK